MLYSRLLTGKRWKDAFPGYQIPQNYSIHGIVALGYAKEANVKGDAAAFRRVSDVTVSCGRQQSVALLQDYVLAQSSGTNDEPLRPTDVWRIKILDKLARLLVDLIKRIDKIVYRIETRSSANTAK